jgi:ZZ-type zinc finger-containing protein 3
MMNEKVETAAESEFYFESDHLALKGNPDYLALVRVLVSLELKKVEAVSDIDTLLREKAQALSSPLQFAERLR